MTEFSLPANRAPCAGTNSTRRTFLHGAAAAGVAWSAAAAANGAIGAEPMPGTAERQRLDSFSVRYCLNTSTIQGERLEVPQQISIAGDAGYDGIELWLRDVERFVEAGGTLAELRQRMADQGLTLESAIAFAPWIVDDEARRRQGLQQAEREMEMVAALGGTRIAAPPAGATDGGKLDLDRAAERYAALLEVGRRVGCVPMLEVWGFSHNLSRLCEVLYVCAATGDPAACVLPDVYHLYKGGSNFAELGLLAGSRLHVFHLNDYPDTPPRESIQDADRIYPTDGVAPLAEILATLRTNGFRGALSLELFNREYWSQEPLRVAQTGLAKMRRAVELLERE